MLYRQGKYLIIIIFLLLSINVQGLKQQKVKKRLPKFIQESLSLKARKLMSTYSAVASAPPVVDSKAQVAIETIKKIEDAKCPRKSVKGDTLVVHYIGYLPDGKEFDSSFRKGKPSTFELGAGVVLPAWDQGLNDMCIGEIRQLTSPSDLSAIAGSSDSNLIFKVELVEIVGYRLPDYIKRDEL